MRHLYPALFLLACFGCQSGVSPQNENDSYHRRLLMYKGQLAPEELLDLDNSDMERQLDIVTQG